MDKSNSLRQVILYIIYAEQDVIQENGIIINIIEYL